MLIYAFRNTAFSQSNLTFSKYFTISIIIASFISCFKNKFTIINDVFIKGGAENVVRTLTIIALALKFYVFSYKYVALMGGDNLVKTNREKKNTEYFSRLLTLNFNRSYS